MQLGLVAARIIWNNKDFRGNDFFSTMTLAFWLYIYDYEDKSFDSLEIICNQHLAVTIETNGDIVYLVISIASIALSITIFIDPTWIIRMINIIVGLLLMITSLMNLINILKYTKNRTASWWMYFSLILLVFFLGIVVIINPLFLANVIVRLEGISLIVGSIITLLLTKKVEHDLLPVKKSE